MRIDARAKEARAIAQEFGLDRIPRLW